jgi:hypothetical protein
VREVDYKDERGRQYRVLLPDGEGEERASIGIPVGPPDVVETLELPEPFATRLHNELFARGLFTAEIARRKPSELQAAILAAAKVDAQTVYKAFVETEEAIQAARKSVVTEVTHE